MTASVGDFPMSFRARSAAICHSEPRPMVECEESPPSYSKRWRLYSRLAGDASLSLSMTYAWGEILRCSTPQNDKQMSFHARTVDRREIPGNKNSYRHTAGVLKGTDGKEHNLHFFPAVAISSIISSGGSGKSGKEARREDRTSPNSPPRI